jgi:hypothetical protein
MDHSDALRLKATEKYLLNELDPDQLDQFEEHMFDCPECAVDVRAAAMFVEQSKAVLSEARGPVPVKVVPARSSGWLNWLRPAFAVPALALLLLVVGYQNLVTYPKLHQAANTPQVEPWAAVNVGVAGNEAPDLTVAQGHGFLMLVRIPPETGVTRYQADLLDPSGKQEWSLPISVPSESDQKQDHFLIRVPGENWASGTYILKIRGIAGTGETRNIGQASVDLKIQ